jgi:hypothetical protein
MSIVEGQLELDPAKGTYIYTMIQQSSCGGNPYYLPSVYGSYRQEGPTLFFNEQSPSIDFSAQRS